MKKLQDFGNWLEDELKRLHVSKSSIRLEGTHKTTLNDLASEKNVGIFAIRAMLRAVDNQKTEDVFEKFAIDLANRLKDADLVDEPP